MRVLFGVLVVSLCCFSVVATEPGTIRPVKYVFLFIGDGLSTPQRMLAREFLLRSGGEDLRINRLPVHGFHLTHSSDKLITDSAAAGTAIACGAKTKSGVLGLDADGNRLESTAALAQRSGRRVGIVTDVSIDHATPAAFYAHNASRSNYYEIGMDLLNSGFGLFFGGNFLRPAGKHGDLYELAAEKGYRLIRDRASFDALSADNAGLTMVLTPRGYVIDSGEDDIDLAELTDKAIAMLDNPHGFFLMVEGGRIDWACHANDAGTVLREVLMFDRAVDIAYRFAEKYPEDTLIVVTGDHETGALTMGFAGTGTALFPERLQHQKISHARFDSILKERKAVGNFSFDDLKPLITDNFGLKFDGATRDPMLLNEHEQKRLATAFHRFIDGARPERGSPESILYGGYNPLCVTVTHILSNKSGIGWSSFSHTSLPVWTSAIGVQAELFAGMADNTDIGRLLMQMVAPLQ